VSGKKGRIENIRVNHVSAEIAAGKPDAGYEYEGPIEDMPRNVSPPVVIAGLPGVLIRNVSLQNIQLKHPGGGNPMFAKVSLNALDSVPEKPGDYPEFSMFHELPAWGIYIRHAQDIQVDGISLSCAKKDYRAAIVLDDVHRSIFATVIVKEPGNKKSFHQYKSTRIAFK
jgi:hypothetical protein